MNTIARMIGNEPCKLACHAWLIEQMEIYEKSPRINDLVECRVESKQMLDACFVMDKKNRIVFKSKIIHKESGSFEVLSEEVIC